MSINQLPDHRGLSLVEIDLTDLGSAQFSMAVVAKIIHVFESELSSKIQRRPAWISFISN